MVFQYLKGSIYLDIHYDGDGGDLASEQSTSGVLLLHGGPIVWSAKKQTIQLVGTQFYKLRRTRNSVH